MTLDKWQELRAAGLKKYNSELRERVRSFEAMQAPEKVMIRGMTESEWVAEIERLKAEIAELDEKFTLALTKALTIPPPLWRFERWCGDGWAYPTPGDCYKFVRNAIDAAREEVE